MQQCTCLHSCNQNCHICFIWEAGIPPPKNLALSQDQTHSNTFVFLKSFLENPNEELVLTNMRRCYRIMKDGIHLVAFPRNEVWPRGHKLFNSDQKKHSKNNIIIMKKTFVPVFFSRTTKFLGCKLTNYWNLFTSTNCGFGWCICLLLMQNCSNFGIF